jgi:hypothetical protein
MMPGLAAADEAAGHGLWVQFWAPAPAGLGRPIAMSLLFLGCGDRDDDLL